MRKIFASFIILILSLLLVNMIYADLNDFWVIHSQGTIKSVGINVYADSACSIALTMIDWGSLAVDTTVSYDAWLKNNGTELITVTMTGNNWSPPEAETALSFAWDVEGAVLGVGEVKHAVFSLTVLNNIVTNFSFDIVVTGTET